MKQREALFLKAVIGRPVALDAIGTLLERRDRLPELIETAVLEVLCEDYDEDELREWVAEGCPGLRELAQYVYRESFAQINGGLKGFFLIATA